MEYAGYIIFLAIFLIAGFIFGSIINKPKDNNYKYKNAMLNAHIELLKDPDYIKILQDIEDSKQINYKIEYPISFPQNFWVKSDLNIKKC